MNIVNKSRVRVNGDKTPFELWDGKATTFNHFKIFGRQFFVNKNDDKLGKFESRVNERILLGCSSISKGYECYNKMLQQIIEIIDVIIDEASIGTKREA